ncbi:MAG: NAD(P)/FAD-dependent oxidoreductase [Bryobacteraceae bacterium]
MSAASYDVVIAGAGIVGAACAAEFAQARLRVALIEPIVVGAGATAAGMGHLAVMDDSEAQFALCRYSQLLWKNLTDRLPADVEYLVCGAIWIAADDDEMAEVQRKQRYYSDHGVPVQVLDRQSLADAEPHLRPGLLGGLLVQEDAVLYPPCAARFLINEAQRHGATLLLGQKLVSFAENTAVLEDCTSLSAAYVVLANGLAAGALVPGLQVQPRKGHLLITDRHPGFLRHQLIELGYLKSAHSVEADSVAFNAQPRQTGQVLIGSSRQYGRDDPLIDSQTMSAMLKRAAEYMPGLRNLSAIRGWTGFRAATPDKLPLIGLCPGYETVYVATGHEGLGITTALGTAKLLADLVLHRECAIPHEPYSPERAYAVHT